MEQDFGDLQEISIFVDALLYTVVYVLKTCLGLLVGQCIPRAESVH